MKNNFTIVLLFALGICLFCSAVFPKKKTFNTDWTPIIFDENFTTPKIEEDDWSYPWYVIKHQDGHFENTMADTILPKDTIHQIHNSRCYSFFKKKNILDKEAHDRLKFCEAKIKMDSLNIEIYDMSASNGEIIFLTIVNNHFKLKYNTAYVFPYKNIEFTYYNQYLKINKKPPYLKDDIIFGEIKTEFEESIIFEKDKTTSTKTKVIKGTFEVKI